MTNVLRTYHDQVLIEALLERGYKVCPGESYLILKGDATVTDDERLFYKGDVNHATSLKRSLVHSIGRELYNKNDRLVTFGEHPGEAYGRPATVYTASSVVLIAQKQLSHGALQQSYVIADAHRAVERRNSLGSVNLDCKLVPGEDVQAG